MVALLKWLGWFVLYLLAFAGVCAVSAVLQCAAFLRWARGERKRRTAAPRQDGDGEGGEA